MNFLILGSIAAIYALGVPIDSFVTWVDAEITASNHTAQDKLKVIESDKSQIDTLDTRIKDLTVHTRETLESELNELQRSVPQQKETIAYFEAELHNQEAAISTQQKSDELRTSQENAIFEGVLSEAQKNINSQQNRVAALDQQLKITVAPDDSDLITGLKNQLQTEEAALANLRTQYFDILRSQQANANSEFSNRSRNQQDYETASINSRLALADAQGELQTLLQKIEQTKKLQAQEENEIKDFQNKKQSLQTEIEQLQAEYSSPKVQKSGFDLTSPITRSGRPET